MTVAASRRIVCVVALVAGALVATVAANTRGRVGRTFPGFFVMRNLVVPSITLPDWSEGRPTRLFQRQIVAVNGRPVTSADEVYDQVARLPVGTAVGYTLAPTGGAEETVVVPSRRFALLDYVLIYGAYLLSGVVFLAAGLLVFLLKPHGAASRALLSVGLCMGVFVTTAADLYGPFWFVRVHVLGESLVAAAFFHLALVFPTERARAHRAAVLAAIYAPFLALAVVYEAVLYRPVAYSLVHLTATAAQGVAGLVIVATVLYDLFRSESALVRRRTSVVALGTSAAFLMPALTMAASALLGGRVPVNAAALTIVFFPASLAYAILQRDLFEIDALLRRATTYVGVVATIGLAYFAALAMLGAVLPEAGTEGSPLVVSMLNLALLFLIAPTQARVQDAVDRLFFRKRFDAERALADLSHALGAAHTVDEVQAETRGSLSATVAPVATDLLLWTPEGVLPPALPGGQPPPYQLPPDLVTRLQRGDILARYEWEDGTARPLPAIWSTLHGELLVPVGTAGTPVAVLALGPKRSGHPYGVHDLAFLRAAASQVALAVTKASAFAQLAELNANLERQVEDRTRALNESLGELRVAYRQHEQNQASLMRADRLATLGRLTAGIAHEVNTPLGAVINSLKVVADLGREYADSAHDPTVGAEDHAEIAAEIQQTAEAAKTWARKAAAFINNVRMHGREPAAGPPQAVAPHAVVAEVQALLAHRLHASACTLEFDDEARGATIVGDPSRLGQVLLNLISNAIDAYEDAHVLDGRIAIRASCTTTAVLVSVRDWAGGIPPAVLPHVFDELFTTKEPGRGTGLGLWIARNLVEQTFAGTLTVESEVGVGSVFTLTLPLAPAATADTLARAALRA